MIPGDRIGTELHHDHRFIVFRMPSPCLTDDPLGDHFRLTGIRVPAVVPVEADDVHVHTLRNTHEQHIDYI